MARPIRARTAPRSRNRQRSEQGKPTAGSPPSKSALAIRSPSRRLSGERLARLRGRDALATAGKMPALLSRERGKQEESKRNGTASLRTQPTCPHPQAQLAGTVPPAPRIETSRNHGANLIKIWGRPAQLAAQNEKSCECRIRASAIFENGRLPQRDRERRLR